MKLKSLIFFIGFITCFGKNFSQRKMLEGRVKTHYSENETRARTIQNMVGACVGFYEDLYSAYIFDLEVQLLTEEEWSKLPYDLPYGIPHITGNVMVVASDSDASPDHEIGELDKSCIHELGHYFFETLANAGASELWAQEFMASYFAVCFLQSKQIDWYLPADEYMPVFRSIADFEQFDAPGMETENYNWYQTRFVQLCYLLYPKLGTQLITAFINKDKNQKMMELLLHLAPEETTTWNETLETKISSPEKTEQQHPEFHHHDWGLFRLQKNITLKIPYNDF